MSKWTLAKLLFLHTTFHASSCFPSFSDCLLRPILSRKVPRYKQACHRAQISYERYRSQRITTYHRMPSIQFPWIVQPSDENLLRMSFWQSKLRQQIVPTFLQGTLRKSRVLRPVPMLPGKASAMALKLSPPNQGIQHNWHQPSHGWGKHRTLTHSREMRTDIIPSLP